MHRYFQSVEQSALWCKGYNASEFGELTLILSLLAGAGLESAGSQARYVWDTSLTNLYKYLTMSCFYSPVAYLEGACAIRHYRLSQKNDAPVSLLHSSGTPDSIFSGSAPDQPMVKRRYLLFHNVCRLLTHTHKLDIPINCHFTVYTCTRNRNIIQWHCTILAICAPSFSNLYFDVTSIG